jgi:Fe2+ or Zn2+ uptake regulation protein
MRRIVDAPSADLPPGAVRVILILVINPFGGGAALLNTERTSDLRLTPQRQAVLEALESATDHPTAAEVFERVRLSVPGIGPATVYRTLALLVAHGLALELSLGDGNAARYDGKTTHHDHLVCSSCGAATDIDSALPAHLMQQMASGTGYAITRYDLQFHGLCPTCQTAQSTPQHSSRSRSDQQEESHG